MKFTIRKGTPDDFEAIMNLVHELAGFQGMSDGIVNTSELMRDEKEYFNCLVAETDEHKIVGMAIYFFAYFTWVGKSLYLDDLVVEKSYRQKGIGTALLNKLMEIAQMEKCRRLRWQVSDWNKNAINLYKKMGATIDSTTFNCDVNMMEVTP